MTGLVCAILFVFGLGVLTGLALAAYGVRRVCHRLHTRTVASLR